MVQISGGDLLSKALEGISKDIKNGGSVDVGFLEDALYPDGTSVAMVAAIQEFGAPRAKIPPRPFFRNMVAKDSPQWPETISKLLVANNYDARKVLGIMGAHIASQLQDSIRETFEPELSPVTLMLRKMRKDNPSLVVTGKTVGEAARRVAAGESYAGVSTKPLVDTGQMLNKVSFRVNT